MYNIKRLDKNTLEAFEKRENKRPDMYELEHGSFYMRFSFSSFNANSSVILFVVVVAVDENHFRILRCKRNTKLNRIYDALAKQD